MRYDISPRALRAAWAPRRGAALVAVLLLTMVLSGIGMMAMQNTFDSMLLSGNFRLRKQAQETADAALTLVSVRAGDRPINYLSRMKADVELNRRAGADIRLQERGGTAVLTSADFGAGAETGLFSDGDPAHASHESDQAMGNVQFRVILRDPSEGPPPTGNDGSFCTKKIFFGSSATHDALVQDAGQQSKSNWDRPARAANAMVGLEAWVGPIPCRGGGSN